MDINSVFKNYGLQTSAIKVGEQTWNLQELTASHIEQIRLASKEGEVSMAAIAIIGGVVNEDGKHVFKTSDKDLILKTLTVKDLMKVTDELFKISGLTEEE